MIDIGVAPETHPHGRSYARRCGSNPCLTQRGRTFLKATEAGLCQGGWSDLSRAIRTPTSPLRHAQVYESGAATAAGSWHGSRQGEFPGDPAGAFLTPQPAEPTHVRKETWS
jgi:hypothetical protein